ncbi:MAG: right-handed parallel beta-helix repeat-containing protein [Promethearchaeota archaeon]
MVLFLFLIKNFNLNHISDAEKLEKTNYIGVKRVGYWDLTGSPIHINDSNPSKNWAYTALNYDWCSGSGTWVDPYIIEDIFIDGKNSDICILIEDSNCYFIIRNCICTNSKNYSFYAGIKLVNTNNGRLINNNCSFNNEDGMIIDDCSNISVINNNLNSNSRVGIYMYDCSLNIVQDNSINNNNYSGVLIENSINNNFSGNILNKCGFFLLDAISQNIDTTNLVNGKPICFYKNRIGLGPNDFKNFGQIILFNCRDSSISNLNLSQSSFPILLYFCKNNTIYRNIVSKNTIGINLDESDNCIISENIASYNHEAGINTINYNGGNNTIIKNSVDYNGKKGINVFGDSNNISGNTVNNNKLTGVSVIGINNTVSRNTANHNSEGMTLWGKNNYIFKNDINYNSEGGLIIQYSLYNKIWENNLKYNPCGIHLYDSNYTIILRNEIQSYYPKIGWRTYGIYILISNYNNYTENLIKRATYGIYISGSYSIFSENRLICCETCIEELQGSIGNVFINNICKPCPQPVNFLLIAAILIPSIIIVISVIIVLVVRRRSKA